MKVIGLTGPTGAGKSTVLDALAGLDCAVIDCDALYRELLDASPALLGELTARFGKSILDTEGKLERKALGRVVFADPQALSDLNAIAHRHVVDACVPLIQQARAQGRRGVVIEAIALLESGLGDLCDVTVAVTAPLEARLKRIISRDNIPEDYARKRVGAQKPDKYYVNLCDLTIENDGSKSPAEFSHEIQALFSDILC